MQEPNDISLPKTGLVIRDQCLIKQSPKGEIIARHPLADLQRAELVRTWDFTGIAIALTFAALAVVAWLFIPWAGVRWAAAILLWAVAGILLLFSFDSAKLHLETRQGSVRYAIEDETENGQGFAITLRTLLEERHHNPPHEPADVPAQR